MFNVPAQPVYVYWPGPCTCTGPARVRVPAGPCTCTGPARVRVPAQSVYVYRPGPCTCTGPARVRVPAADWIIVINGVNVWALKERYPGRVWQPQDIKEWRSAPDPKIYKFKVFNSDLYNFYLIWWVVFKDLLRETLF